MNNPLFSLDYGTPYNTIPFNKIKEEHFKPAFDHAIELAKKEVDAIVNNTESPTYENTIEALEKSGRLLGQVSSIFFNINSAETNETIQAIAQEVSPLITAFGNDVQLNVGLFKRVKEAYDNRVQYTLNEEQTTLLNNTYKSFARNGANCSEEDKTKLRELDNKIAKLQLTFGQNILAETNNYHLHITKEEDLDGLPQYAIDTAKANAESRSLEGWVITLDFPSFMPFMKYATNEALRKVLYIAYGSRGYQDNEFNNEKNVIELVQAKHDRAKVLGYENHSQYVLEERMAKSPETVNSFLLDLKSKALPVAKKEIETLKKYSFDKFGVTELNQWDHSFYVEKQKQELYNINDEELKPYFVLDKCIDGMFEIANRLFGITFEQITSIDTYHSDVKTYKVTDSNNGDLVAIFYADFHPRKGKRGGAWMTSYKSQFIEEGINHRPHTSIVCNFTEATGSLPALLTFNELTTLFHEFGHALHGMLANTQYGSLSGTSVRWDFVELPSQIMENWCYEKEALELFAQHYQTGETIPLTYIEKIKEAATFMEGYATIRQLKFGIEDIAWHSLKDETNITSLKSFLETVSSDLALYPQNEKTCHAAAFGHIFAGGYDSGYYSYKWAEVLDADAFEYFLENGIFNKDIAQKFKSEILEKGGTIDPQKLYQNFRGRDAKNEALLKRAGLLNADTTIA